MEDGLSERENVIYLRASMGKLRKRTTKEDPKAVEWADKDGAKHYDLVYSNLTGILLGVSHKDGDYGHQWTFKVKAGETVYAVQLAENSKFGLDFLKKLPNLTQGKRYKFTPWEVERDGNTKGGIAIVRAEDEEKIQSFYQNFAGSEEEGWTITNVNGFPDIPMAMKKMAKDDWKIYFIQVAKFLREKSLNFLATKWVEGAVAPQATKKNDAVQAEIKQAEVSDMQEPYEFPKDDDLPY